MDNRIIVEPASKIREIARNSLAGYWKEMFVGVLLYFLLSTGISTFVSHFFDYYYEMDLGYGMSLPVLVPYASSLYNLVLEGALMLGLYMFIVSFFRRGDINYGNILEGFGMFGKAFWLYLLYTIKVALWTCLFIVPGIIATFRYSQAFLLRIDHPDWTGNQCLRASSNMMKGNKGKLFYLYLTFIGWGILAGLPDAIFSEFVGTNMNDILYIVMSLIMAIPTVIVSLYINVSEVAFYELLTGNLVVAEEYEDNNNMY